MLSLTELRANIKELGMEIQLARIIKHVQTLEQEGQA
jgi:hypothetical protein